MLVWREQGEVSARAPALGSMGECERGSRKIETAFQNRSGYVRNAGFDGGTSHQEGGSGGPGLLGLAAIDRARMSRADGLASGPITCCADQACR